jgi:hypothetical protein
VIDVPGRFFENEPRTPRVPPHHGLRCPCCAKPGLYEHYRLGRSAHGNVRISSRPHAVILEARTTSLSTVGEYPAIPCFQWRLSSKHQLLLYDCRFLTRVESRTVGSQSMWGTAALEKPITLFDPAASALVSGPNPGVEEPGTRPVLFFAESHHPSSH